MPDATVPAAADVPTSDVGPDSTLENVRGLTTARRGRAGRRVVLAGMAAVVVLGATGFTGLRTARATATGDGYRMTLVYPRIARAGLDVRWQVTVRRDGGFPAQESIVLAVTGDYFDIFETQGFYPEPDGETRDGRWRYLEFSPHDGADTFVVDFDTYVQPSSQIGRDAVVRLLVDDVEHARIAYSTFLLP